MKGYNFRLTEMRKTKYSDKKGIESDENRPVRFVPDGHNSWRVVWADEARR
ncbi:MAG: hypothetical protein KGI04_02090 [Candidatus Micrarchaeota archaeon]|nr:hypothetical protein [Candidatus Micrarchaeota archaeon]